ncbi:GH92 family glycosyl hydrolase [Mangrovibacterium marinum]|uniref:Putative alpha-1,2-mannosidase n=1 Tax=Mangrovibacterium marinum TaxID=1639118 RepID=A0A2T5BXN2_9BACT|nr:GH92 family glycosyl hydrolase [Mangrovibacterium marinum]PTN05299.1 putative alpha-1,2-mannosidase [Mangrovibacterium marinum]
MKKRFLQATVLLTFCCTGISCMTDTASIERNVDYVNPLIGTAPSTTISALKHGEGTENNSQVVPFVTVPFGMTNWTAQTKDTETKCVAPYYYADSIIQGFRGSHWLSGSCVQDYGSVTIMPIAGELKCLPEERGSSFSHDNEISTPYFYHVRLDDYAIEAEMTATKRCGLFKFTFEKGGESHLVINPNSDEGQGFIQIIPEKNEIAGYNPVHRIYQGWGEPAGFSGYFVARFSHDFEKYGTYQDSLITELATEIANQAKLGAWVTFNLNENEPVYVEVGTSFTSIDEARANLDAETADLDFEQAKTQLKESWERLLSKVQVEGSDEEAKVKFYTALYHSFLQPRTFNDVDGSYPAFAGGKQILNSGSRDYFDDFSMWDTYRASHPLFNLLVPEKNAEMMYSLLDKAQQGNWLPIFPCWNSYTSAMIGDHAAAAIADAYSKDVIDLTDAQYQLLLKNAFQSPETFAEYKEGKGRRALESYLEYGYIPMEDSVQESFHKKEQVSRTLEYAFDDFTLSRIAEKRGDTERAAILRKRALNYQNVYSPADSCVRGKYLDGRWAADFNKYIRQPYITEGTPWQYTWYVPQDVRGLMDLMGGEDGFNCNLDQFHASGQYWHGNEPGHQIPFLYNYSGQPWKSQQLVSEIMVNEYGTGPGGLSGNDDAGQMSAWYVFAALGFYPVCPSVPEYVISGPHFDKITIELEGGKQLVIHAPGASSGKNYIQGMNVNGQETDLNYFNHFDLIKGGTINFEMGDLPNKSWGVATKARPYSLSND